MILLNAYTKKSKAAQARFSVLKGESIIAQAKAHRLNEEITAPQVRLIGATGEQLGIVDIRTAQRTAEDAGVDLVEIAPNAAPPVCRVMDYGKFKYQEAKRAHESRQKQKQVQLKEIKLRPGTDENDYQIKLRNMLRFLEDGDKVKVTLRFRGREMAHQEFGARQLERVKADLNEIGNVEQMPKMEGRQMIMVVAPAKKKSGKSQNKPKAVKVEKAENAVKAESAKPAENATENKETEKAVVETV